MDMKTLNYLVAGMIGFGSLNLGIVENVNGQQMNIKKGFSFQKNMQEQIKCLKEKTNFYYNKIKGTKSEYFENIPCKCFDINKNDSTYDALILTNPLDSLEYISLDKNSKNKISADLYSKEEDYPELIIIHNPNNGKSKIYVFGKDYQDFANKPENLEASMGFMLYDSFKREIYKDYKESELSKK